MQKRATIKDIARIAQVSPTAVSMAINNLPEIGQETRKRILSIAKKLNYRPNTAARSLVTSRSNTIGLIITTFTNPVYPEVAIGIEDKALELGYSVITCSTRYSTEIERQHVGMLQSRGVDGIIFNSVERCDPNIAPLLRQGFPFVLINRRVSESPLDRKTEYVVLDDAKGAYMAMEHLYSLGHRRIGIIEGMKTSSTAEERTRGAMNLLRDRGLEIDPALIAECHWDRKLAYMAARRMLKLKKPPTAFFSENDYMALSVREAVLDLGYSVPEDIALVGFDNIDVSGIRGIDLTTIGMERHKVGGQAVELLIRKIKEPSAKEPRHIVMEPRWSSGNRADPLSAPW